jgi:NAD(P)-dependent dehydrogenase (short-subunit alcohol dehydrogenase family)
MQDGRLAGRRIVVTGAGSGIGLAATARLRRDAALVLGVDRAGAVELCLDVTEGGAPTAIISAALEQLGGLDGLVTCAGVSHFEALEGHGDASWDRTMAVNVTAVFRLIREAVPALRASGRGRVVTIGSVMSSFGAPGMVAYTASKHAVLGLTRAMASELGPDGINVSCVQPGAILTPMTQDYLSGGTGGDFWKAKSSLGRLGDPEDVAGVIAFLVSDDARFVSGHGLLVDGAATQHV